MNLNLFDFKLTFHYNKAQLITHHPGQKPLTRLPRHVDPHRVTLQNSVDGKDSLSKAHCLKLFSLWLVIFSK